MARKRPGRLAKKSRKDRANERETQAIVKAMLKEETRPPDGA